MSGSGKSGGTKDQPKQKQVVVLIDGKAVRQFYTSIYLQRLDYHVIMARTAEDAMLFLELTVPLVVITNYDLPAMSGLELLEHVKQEESTRNVPVVIYTGNGDPAIQQACEEAGCAGFLRHPCTLDDLYAMVQKAIGVRPRKYVRLNTRLEVIIEDAADDRLDFISDLSEEGMFISSTAPLPYGSIHTFAFHLPNAPGWVVRAEGQVQHMHPGPGRRKSPGMGVRFLRIGEREQALVKDFIRHEMKEGLAPDR